MSPIEYFGIATLIVIIVERVFSVVCGCIKVSIMEDTSRSHDKIASASYRQAEEIATYYNYLIRRQERIDRRNRNEAGKA